MKERIIALECLRRRTRMAVIEDGIVCEYAVEYRDGPQVHKEGIYVGRVNTFVRATQSVFVDIGTGKDAILHVEKGDKDVRAGALVIVQVQREPPSAEKGPRVTREIQLSGRFCVLCIGRKGIGISQKITDDAQRARLIDMTKDICPPGMGIIVRTLAQEAEEDEMRGEVMRLAEEWNDIQRRARGMTRPGMISTRRDLIDTVTRDLFSPQLERIKCDDAQICARIAEMVPQFKQKIECYDAALPLFDAMQLETKLEKALARKIRLKSGASLVIDPCEALTVIDVNSGQNIRARNSEQNALNVNLEAADEIARQLRLRDIGGIVVIDFIDMAQPQNRRVLIDMLRNAVSCDRSHVQVGELSPLGLCELTRKALRREIRMLEEEPCRVCRGKGSHATARARAYDVLMQIRRRAWGNGMDGQYLLTADAELIHAVKKMDEEMPCAALWARECEMDKEHFSLTQLPLLADTTSYQRIDIGSGKR